MDNTLSHSNVVIDALAVPREVNMDMPVDALHSDLVAVGLTGDLINMSDGIGVASDGGVEMLVGRDANR